jgi:hypothetical protein
LSGPGEGGKKKKKIGKDDLMVTEKGSKAAANLTPSKTKSCPLNKNDVLESTGVEETSSGGNLGTSSSKFLGTWDQKLGRMTWERMKGFVTYTTGFAQQVHNLLCNKHFSRRNEDQELQLDLDPRTQSYFPRVSSLSRIIQHRLRTPHVRRYLWSGPLLPCKCRIRQATEVLLLQLRNGRKETELVDHWGN